MSSSSLTIFALCLLSGLLFPGGQSLAAEQSVNLPVPFTPEAPDGLMIKPWNNSCEEASTVMLDEYYKGNTQKTIHKGTAKTAILNYVATENKIFGYNANTNAAEIAKLVNEYSKNFEASIKTNPTLEEIKAELSASRPVFALLYGYNLHNPRIQFARNGSSTHFVKLSFSSSE